MVVHTFNPCIPEAKAGIPQGVEGQTELLWETLCRGGERAPLLEVGTVVPACKSLAFRLC